MPMSPRRPSDTRLLPLALALTVLSLRPSVPLAAEGSFTFAVAADMRQFAGPGTYDSTIYFRGVSEALDSRGRGEFMISPGDIDPPDGVRWTLDRVFGPGYVWYPVVGNHEAETPADMEYLRKYPIVPVAGEWAPAIRWGPRYGRSTTYSFDYGNCHFVVINEYFDGFSDVGTNGDIGDSLYAWLEADLAATEKEHIFVSGHEPAYPRPDRDNLRERHMFDSLNQHPENRDRFWALLAEHGVLAYLCGHTHNHSVYERDGVWQIDAGHARGKGDTGAASTFQLIHVMGPDVLCVTYREVHDNFDYDYDDIVHSDWLTSPIPDSTPFVATSVTGAGAPRPVDLRAAPNPFNPATRILFDLAEGGDATVSIADIRGAIVRTLIDGPVAAGARDLRWDGRDDGGRAVPSGVYFALVRSGEGTARKKIVLVR